MQPAAAMSMEERIANAIRASLEAVLPDPDRSDYIDRLNERFGDGTGTVGGAPTALVRLQPVIAAGGVATVVSYRLPSRIPRAFITRWWHGIELDQPDQDPDLLRTAWANVHTDVMLEGIPLRGLGGLQGQRTDPMQPGILAQKMSGSQEFAIRMRLLAGYVGVNIRCNAAFRGHTA